MLSKIIDMDEQARALNAKAEQSKVDSQKEIAKAKEDIYNDFIERARQRICTNEKAAREAAEKELALKKEKQALIMSSMEDLYKQKKEQWVNTIVENVIKS